MRKVEIEGEAKITFYQTIDVTDEEFEILEGYSGKNIDEVLAWKFDPDCINEIKDFYIYNIEEVND